MVENLVEEKRKKEIQVLHKAFESFNTASKKLETSYNKLRGRIKELDTELAQKNKALKKNLNERDQAKNYLHKILESLNSGVLVTDSKKNITTFNKSAEAITGYPSKKVLGKHIKDVFPKKLIDDTLHPLMKSDDPGKSLDRTFVTINKRKVNIRVSASPLKLKEGSSSETVFIIQDITQLKRLEEEVQRNQRLSAMGEMAAGIAHEIRNPLGSIELFASLLKKDLAGEADKQLLADHICNGVKNMDRIISSILLFAKSPEPVRQQCDINALLNELLEFSSNIVPAENITIHRKLSKGKCLVNGDSDLLKQVFLNFIRNATQAIQVNGELKISTEEILKTKSDQKSRSGRGHFVNVIVSDNGSGISPENLSKIFNPFFTTKARGTGLGMAIAYNIIKAHHGSIEVESQEGKGTKFTVKLPAWNK